MFTNYLGCVVNSSAMHPKPRTNLQEPLLHVWRDAAIRENADIETQVASIRNRADKKVEDL